MLDRLPEYIDPLQLADKRGAIKGKLSLSELKRLDNVLVNSSGSVEISLFFSKEGKHAKIDGHIDAVLELVCQNCLNPIEWVVDNEIKIGIVTSLEQANRLPEDYGPLLLEVDEKILLKDIIEDELLLILPDFPKHQQPCFSQYVSSSKANLSSDNHLIKESPFSILNKLKNTGDH